MADLPRPGETAAPSSSGRAPAPDNRAGRAGPSAVPTTAVIVLNHNGRHHLEACLPAALALDGLSGPAAVVVADNGSTDGSAAFVRERFGGITLIEHGANLGFAAGNNRAAAAVDAEQVLFLNNDTRVAPDVLVRLSDARSGRADDRGAAVAATVVRPACAGARLVSWDGRRLDFDGGGAAFSGHGHALGYGRPVPPARPAAPDAPRPTLFASGAAMLVDRGVFLGLGGFDPDYFAYYEDVDLGWRLWLAGHAVVHVPSAVVRHRHHGTAASIDGGFRATLFERNALATVVKNYAEGHLAAVLPAALALAAVRAGAPTDVIAEAASLSGPRRPSESDPADRLSAPARPSGASTPARPSVDAAPSRLPLPAAAWSGWPYLASLGLDFGALAEARAAVQAERRRDDAEILALLVAPYAPVPATAASAAALSEAVRAFGLAAIFGPPPDAPRGLRGWLVRARRAAAVLGAEGPGGLAAAVRAYAAWRRLAGGARR